MKPYSGTPCKRGHKAPRYETNDACVECSRLSSKKQYATVKADPVLYREHKARARAHYDGVKAQSRMLRDTRS